MYISHNVIWNFNQNRLYCFAPFGCYCFISLTVLFDALRAQICSVTFLISMVAYHAFSGQHYLAHSIVFSSFALLFLMMAVELTRRSVDPRGGDKQS